MRVVVPMALLFACFTTASYADGRLGTAMNIEDIAPRPEKCSIQVE
jgi:hypothetical protein